MNRNNKDAVLKEILIKYYDDSLTDSEFQELQSQLISDSKAREIYWDYTKINIAINKNLEKSFDDILDNNQSFLFLDEALKESMILELQSRREIEETIRKKTKRIAENKLKEYLGSAVKDHHEIHTQSRITKQPILHSSAFRAIAACLIVGLSLWLYFQTTSSVQVAKITNSYQAKWAVEPDKIIHNSEYHLISGLAEIEFNDGAKVILEGPLEIKLESANGAFLKQGKLVAYIPSQAKGFTLRAPNVEYVDLGTEFAVKVLPDGSSECHVIQGLVQINANQTVEIKAGQAKGVLSDGNVIAKDYSRSMFFNQLQPGNIQPNWKAYEKAILASNPSGFWDFEGPQNEIRNNVRTSTYRAEWVSEHSKTRQIPKQTENRNTFLDLDGVAGYFSLNESTHNLNGYTLMFHLWLDQIKPQYILRQINPGDNQTFYSRQLEMDKDGILQLSGNCLRNSEANPNLLLNCEIQHEKPGLQEQNWHHVAITISQDWLVMRMYVNGQLYSRAVTSKQMPFESDFADILFAYKPTSSPTEVMQGAIDNVVFYNMALTSSDINAMYKKTQ